MMLNKTMYVPTGLKKNLFLSILVNKHLFYNHLAIDKLCDVVPTMVLVVT